METDKKSVTITTSYLAPGCAAQVMLETAGFSVHFSSESIRRQSGQPLRECVQAADGLILGTEPLTADDLESIVGLRVVGRTGAGFDNVNIDSARQHGVVVCNTPGTNRQSVVELTLALMLNLARDLPANIASTRNGQWLQKSGAELSGSVLGIMGMGDIGRAVAKSATALGMDVIGHDPMVDPATLESQGVLSVPFEDLLKRSDFLSLHLALTSETANIINGEALRLMKQSAFLINTSRGGIVNEADLIQALSNGQIAGAALDVIAQEPVDNSSPLLTAPNLLLTAHIAGATVQARRRSEELAAQQIIDFFRGSSPKHKVSL